MHSSLSPIQYIRKGSKHAFPSLPHTTNKKTVSPCPYLPSINKDYWRTLPIPPPPPPPHTHTVHINALRFKHACLSLYYTHQLKEKVATTTLYPSHTQGKGLIMPLSPQTQEKGPTNPLFPSHTRKMSKHAPLSPSHALFILYTGEWTLTMPLHLSAMCEKGTVNNENRHVREGTFESHLASCSWMANHPFFCYWCWWMQRLVFAEMSTKQIKTWESTDAWIPTLIFVSTSSNCFLPTHMSWPLTPSLRSSKSAFSQSSQRQMYAWGSENW